MGREWYFGGSGGAGEGTGGDKVSKREKRSSTPPGCMSAVFHFFDFYPCFNQHQSTFLHEDPIILKGVEAPRNSLESEDVFMEVDSSLSPEKQRENLNIPMCIQIKPDMDGSSSEISSSPSTKTPNLVARLMGLDLLPLDAHSLSPRSSSSSSNQQPHAASISARKILSKARRNYSENDVVGGTRSLPETPRVSSERKSVSNSQHPRLSLQIIREKVMENDENNNRLSTSSSPSYYARQIVKQVKESVGRRVGLDITNTVKNRPVEEIRRDEKLLGMMKEKKALRKSANVVNGGDELVTMITDSCSTTRFKLIEKNKSITSSSSFSISKLDSQLKSEQKQERKCTQKSKQITGEKFKSRSSEIIRRTKKEEQFVPKKTNRKIPPLLSDDRLPVTKLQQNQIGDDAQEQKRVPQLHRHSSSVFKPETKQTREEDKDVINNGLHEFQYITKILKYAGINKDTQMSFFTNWFSSSHPLNPSIFHHFESTFFTFTDQLVHRCNRKFIFDLVDEILLNYLNLHHHHREMRGSDLIKKLCEKINSYPKAKCEDLQDIDALVGKDLQGPSSSSSSSTYQSGIKFENEGEIILLEIENDMIDSLIHETVLLYSECGFC